MYINQSFTSKLFKGNIEDQLAKFINSKLMEGFKLITVTSTVDKTFKREYTAHMMK